MVRSYIKGHIHGIDVRAEPFCVSFMLLAKSLRFLWSYAKKRTRHISTNYMTRQRRGSRKGAIVMAYALMMQAQNGDDGDNKPNRLPWFEGAPGTWREWERRAYAWESSTTLPQDKKGTRLIGHLKGDAWDAVEHLPVRPGTASTIARDDGFERVMVALREAFARTDESERIEALEDENVGSSWKEKLRKLSDDWSKSEHSEMID